MHKLALRIHRWLALPFGLIISLLCLSGALLLFQDEIVHALNADKYHLTPSAGMQHLADDELQRRVEEQLPPGQILMAIEVSDVADAPANAVIAGMGRADFLVNPYTGEVYGTPTGIEFFEGVRSLHRFLFDTPDGAQRGALTVGRAVVGLTAVAMTLILLTGVFLWWPRNRKMLPGRLTVSTRKGIRRFVYDSHVSLGIYAAVFLLLMSLTGPAWTFGWYKNAAMTVTGFSECPTDGQTAVYPAPIARPDGHSGAIDVSQEHATKVRHLHTAAQPHSAGFHQFLQNLHFGRWGGLLTRVLYLLAALIGASLPWTGYYLWWKRSHRTQVK